MPAATSIMIPRTLFMAISFLNPFLAVRLLHPKAGMPGLTSPMPNPYREIGASTAERNAYDCLKHADCCPAQEDRSERYPPRSQGQNGGLRRLGDAGRVSRGWRRTHQ